MRRSCLMVAALLVSGLVACGSPARDQAHDSLVDQLVAGGLPKQLAVCVVDEFFDGKSNDELKGFFQRHDLTEAERAEFAKLGAQCQAP